MTPKGTYWPREKNLLIIRGFHSILFLIKTSHWFISLGTKLWALVLLNLNLAFVCAVTASIFLVFRVFFTPFHYTENIIVEHIQCFSAETACMILCDPAVTMTSLTHLLLNPFSSHRCWGCFFSLRTGQGYCGYYKLRELIRLRVDFSSCSPGFSSWYPNRETSDKWMQSTSVQLSLNVWKGKLEGINN